MRPTGTSQPRYPVYSSLTHWLRRPARREFSPATATRAGVSCQSPRRSTMALVLIAMVASATSCSVARPDEFPTHPVFRAVLDSVARQLSAEIKIVVFHTSWSPEGALEWAKSLRPPRSVVTAYRRANRVPSRISDDLNVPILDGTLLPLDDHSPVADDWWAELRTIHGDGAVWVVFLSQPGFSPDGDRALIHYEFACGPLCGESHVALAQSVDGDWSLASDTLYAVW